MPETTLSVIVPIRNLHGHISSIIKGIAAEAVNIDFEVIIVDMGSSDSSMLQAIQTLKREKIKGMVVQSGESCIGAALNIGISKSAGEYITFCFPKKLYKNYYESFLNTAKNENADMVFGPVPEHGEIGCLNSLMGKLDNTELMIGILNSLISIDIAAILLRRDFVRNKHILFSDTCRFGFSEEFIFRAIFSAESIFQVTSSIVRDKEQEPPVTESESVSSICFDKVDALKRIEELIRYQNKSNKKLYNLFVYEKIPDTVLICVDILLNEGFSYTAVRNAIKLKNYEKLLQYSKETDGRLKREILLWKRMPWLYKPRTTRKR
ncbi:MAG: glycosyltransferase [Bacillota bacterium]|nr:glycosyltransferase [Bacillota bacterium]